MFLYNKYMFLLLGYGFSNKQVHKFLKRKRKKILIYDDNLKGNKFIKNVKNWYSIKTIVVSAGIKPNHPLLVESLKYNIKILTDLDIFYKYKNNKDILIGITGSNGKTTTVSLIGEILNNFKINNWVCGNIGVSIFNPLIKFYKKPLIYVIEISSYQCSHMKNILFHIGGIINIYNNHDEWHDGFENYKKAKEKLLDFSNIKVDKRKIFENEWVINNDFVSFNKELMFEINNEKLLFIQNKENLIFSLKIIEILFKNILNINLTCPESKLNLEKINSFQCPPFRQEIIYKDKDLIVVNDSKSTNIDSSIMAINNFLSFKKNILLIMGGIIKGNIDSLTKQLLNKISIIYIFGESRFFLEHYLKENNYVSYKIFNKLNDSISSFSDNLLNINNYIILFSPGGASYDEFKNYIHRGKKFQEILKYINKN